MNQWLDLLIISKGVAKGAKTLNVYDIFRKYSLRN